MQFPMKDGLTQKQATDNNVAQYGLVRGTYYCFEPPVIATAVPTGGPKVCALEECKFDRGFYLGMKDGNYIFQGKPLNDKRKILVPPSHKGAPNKDELLENLRDSYFHVLFIGGSMTLPDYNQSH